MENSIMIDLLCQSIVHYRWLPLVVIEIHVENLQGDSHGTVFAM